MKRKTRYRYGSILGLTIFAAAGGGAWGASEVPAAEQGAEQQLQEIVVTTTRRRESLEKVPVSIEALNQEALAENGVKGISDLAAISPGLQYAEPNALPSTITTVAIRGMNSNTGQSVTGIYLDDTPLQTRLSPLTNFGNPYPAVFDLNRVEVARGPQGTLFGAGSEAGTIRFISNEPSLTEFSGTAHAELAAIEGGSQSYEAGIAYGGPIIADKLGMRLSLWDRHDGGYIDQEDMVTGQIVNHDANTNDKFAFRAAFAAQIADGVSITPTFFYQDGKRGDGGRFYEILSDASDARFINGRMRPERSNDRFWLPSVKIEAQLGFADLTAVTSYIDRKAEVTLDQSSVLGEVGLVPGFPQGGFGNPLGTAYPASERDVNYTVYGQNMTGITQEIRLASTQPDAFVTWVAGLFYDRHQQTDYGNEQDFAVDPTGASILYYYQTSQDTQYAAFAQADFHLTKELTATVGDRIALDRTSLYVRNGDTIQNAGEMPTFKTPTQRETPQTPKVSLSYQADKSDLFYVSAGEGFRIGGGNPGLPNYCAAPSANVQTFTSDNVWNYEAGAKNGFFDGKLQVDTSVFHDDWKKIQQMVFLSCGFQYTANAGSAAFNGFDMSLRAVLLPQLKVTADIGYVDAYFTSSVYDDKGNPLVLKGEKVGQLPQVNAPWNVNLAADYDIPLGGVSLLRLRAEYRYKSRNPGPFVTQNPTSSNYFPLITADPPITTENLKITYVGESEDIMFFVDNLSNSHPLLQKFQETANSNFVSYNTLTPRTFGVSVDFPF